MWCGRILSWKEQGLSALAKEFTSFHASEWDEINSSTHDYDSLFYKTSKMWSCTPTDQMSAICFLFQQPRKEIHLFQRGVIKYTRHKTDSEPLFQDLDQLNATVLVFLARQIRFLFLILPRNLWAKIRPPPTFKPTIYRETEIKQFFF